VVEIGLVDVLGQLLPTRSAIECATGNAAEARAHGADALAACVRTGDRWYELGARSALGFLELSLGNPAGAQAWLAPAIEITDGMDLREPGAFTFVPDEVEALVALGELEPAKALTERLEDQGKSLDRPLALATSARCRGLITAALGDLPGAARHLERSLEEHERLPQPFELARSLLVAGEVERRMKKKRSARDALDRALRVFEELGAPLWVEKTLAELTRIGGRAPAQADLTPTEALVAKLVAEGRTNREVGDALFISVHTVEANLKRIYRKLQVRSRTELARKL
jgi:DNA-binding CsgD family transcriptional regulator